LKAPPPPHPDILEKFATKTAGAAEVNGYRRDDAHTVYYIAVRGTGGGGGGEGCRRWFSQRAYRQDITWIMSLAPPGLWAGN